MIAWQISLWEYFYLRLWKKWERRKIDFHTPLFWRHYPAHKQLTVEKKYFVWEKRSKRESKEAKRGWKNERKRRKHKKPLRVKKIVTDIFLSCISTLIESMTTLVLVNFPFVKNENVIVVMAINSMEWKSS